MGPLEKRFAVNWTMKGFGSGRHSFLLALSGGLDSMVLAGLLQSAGISFAAAHCNFGLRGADSEGDETFVTEWCRQNDIRLFSKQFDVGQEAGSTQMAARKLRYKWFSALVATHHFASVLTAHHADDVAETVLINLVRGTGISGLHGIPEKRGDIIRPLLFASRADILQYAADNKIPWREDASNATTLYLRNAIRHQVLPRLNEIAPGATMRIAESARHIAEAETVYRATIKVQLKKLAAQRGRDWYLPVKLWQKTPQKELLMFEWTSNYGFSPGQTAGILSLLSAGSGSRVASGSHTIIRHRDFLVLTANAAPDADLIVLDHATATIKTAHGVLRIFGFAGAVAIQNDRNVALIDADDLEWPLTIRTRREGDYFYPLGMGGKKKKLKRYLIDEKVPLHEKDRICIIETGRKIIWIAGYRLDERFKVTPSTKTMLRIEWLPV